MDPCVTIMERRRITFLVRFDRNRRSNFCRDVCAYERKNAGNLSSSLIISRWPTGPRTITSDRMYDNWSLSLSFEHVRYHRIEIIK